MKNHWNKPAALGMAAIMALSFTACGNEKALDEPSSSGASSAPETAVETVTDENGRAVLNQDGEPVTKAVTFETGEASGGNGMENQMNPGKGRSDGSPTPEADQEPADSPHIHAWVEVSPENSYHMEYGAECRIHGYNGEEPMFFQTQNDLFLHQAADGCTSSWGSGFKGLAYRYCSICGEEVITGHVHDFGTVAKQVYFEKVVCECGMSFSAGKDYTALESWNTHVESYVSHGYPREDHDSYQTVTSSVTRYEATKTCTCG